MLKYQFWQGGGGIPLLLLLVYHFYLVYIDLMGLNNTGPKSALFLRLSGIRVGVKDLSIRISPEKFLKAALSTPAVNFSRRY